MATLVARTGTVVSPGWAGPVVVTLTLPTVAFGMAPERALTARLVAPTEAAEVRVALTPFVNVTMTPDAIGMVVAATDRVVAPEAAAALSATEPPIRVRSHWDGYVVPERLGVGLSWTLLTALVSIDTDGIGGRPPGGPLLVLLSGAPPPPLVRMATAPAAAARLAFSTALHPSNVLPPESTIAILPVGSAR